MKYTISTAFQENIGKRIRYFRRKKKWTQQELGEACGTCKDIIGRCERGEENMGVQILGSIMEALEVDATRFFRSKLFVREARPAHLYKNNFQEK